MSKFRLTDERVQAAVAKAESALFAHDPTYYHLDMTDLVGYARVPCENHPQLRVALRKRLKELAQEKRIRQINGCMGRKKWEVIHD